MPASRSPNWYPNRYRRWYHRLTIGQRRAITAWLFLSLPLLYFFVVRFIPTVSAFALAFMEWNVLGEKTWVGLANFKAMFDDPVFWKSMLNTFIYLFLGVPLSLVTAFIIAWMLDRIGFGHSLLRGMYFLPYMTTAAVISWVWRWMYQPYPMGVFNNILAALGFSSQPFLNSTDQSLVSILIAAIWQHQGFNIIIFIAGIRAIPSTYYEAARIDGAGEWMILRDITLPQLRPTFIFLTVMASIGFLRIFDFVYNMTSDGEGGPLNASRTMVIHIYKTAFNSYEMGYAAAQTVILFIFILAFTVLQMRFLRAR